jgi:hypothetical protein
MNIGAGAHPPRARRRRSAGPAAATNHGFYPHGISSTRSPALRAAAIAAARSLAARARPVEALEPRRLLAGNVVINEIMYHASSQNVNDEWVELYNKGGSAVDLSGWHFAKGIDFAFAPGTSLGAGQYLVVAHDLSAFQAKYPGVGNVVGGWNGQLGNNGDTIELDDATGTAENTVGYGTDGEWAVREHGHGVQLVGSITRSGSTATVTIPAHRFNNGDQVQIFGAAQPEYNGTFTISGVTPSTFNITVSGTPASPATPATPDGTILCRQLTDLGHGGVSWFAAHDGLGKSLELINPALPNDAGENWTASTANQGTPGAPNSVLSGNVAPLILDAKQSVIVPKSTDAVTITARLVDESGHANGATLYYRIDSLSPPAFTPVTMHDDGLNGDALAGDGIWTGQIPPQVNNAIVEWYISANDGLRTRTWPAPMSDATQSANALYQVDDSPAYTGNQPVFKLIMREVDRQELASIGSPGSSVKYSNATFNGTFISTDSTGTEVRYHVGFRNRGGGSRDKIPNNRRVDFNNSDAERWQGVRGINLNGQYSMQDVIGSAVVRAGGVPAQTTVPVQVRVNNVNEAVGNVDMFGSYSWLQSEDGDMVKDHFGADPAGNYYRGVDPSHNANLSYLGPTAAPYYDLYPKQNNTEPNDYTDLIGLIAALDPTQTPDSTGGDPNNFVNVIKQHLNIDEAMRYFAINAIIGNEETALGTGVGDDFAMYRGVIDPRFQLVAHDLDTILGRGDSPGLVNINETLFKATSLATVKRLLTNPAFAPIFFKALRDLVTGPMSPANLFPILDQTLADYVPTDVINSMKAFITGRENNILATIPTTLTVSSPLAISNGYPSITGTTATIDTTLSGVADVTRTRSVLVNGVAVSYTAVPSATPTTGPYGAWSAATVTLQPGLNRVLVQALDADGKEIGRQTIDLYYNRTGGTTIAAGNVSGTWSPANGPYTVTGSVTVAAGQTLTILPGTTVFFGTNSGILVNGTLNAQGTDSQRIRLTRMPGATTTWKGLDFENTTNDNRLAYVDMEYGDAGFYAPARGSTPNVMVNNSRISIDHMTWAGTTKELVNCISSSIKMTNSVTPNCVGVEPIHFWIMPATGFAIFQGNTFGSTTQHNDIIDLTSGSHTGPVAQFLDNYFLGNGPAGNADDLLDLDSANAYCEGNVFTNVSNTVTADTNSAISGGTDPSFPGVPSEITSVRNYFYNVEHAYLFKEGNFLTSVNNTYVGVLKSVYNFDEPGNGTAGPGRGAFIDGDVIYNIAPGGAIFTNYNAGTQLSINHSLLPFAPPAGIPQVGNIISTDPRFVAGTNIASLATANDIRAGLALRAGSPALGTGPNGRDMGAAVPAGASIFGEPLSPTSKNSATLTIGGRDIYAYRYRINGGAWSAEVSTTGTQTINPTVPAVQLTGLAPGTYTVQVEARNYAGVLQADAAATTSRTWTVTGAPTVLINEVLAQNQSAVNHEGTTPDLVELYNNGPATVDLGDMSISDDPAAPRKFVFSAGTTIAPGQYLVLYADDPNGTSGIHLGFAFKDTGEGAYLYDTPASGGGLLDSVAFGQQLPDLSIGRLANGTWGLTKPTLGAANVVQPTGDASLLKINEWLASGVAPLQDDFVELYNPDTLPVNLGGLSLTDQPLGWPNQSPIPSLSFIPASGFATFIADGHPNRGGDHLSFKLSHDRGEIALFDGNLNRIDSVIYKTQKVATSQGRSPNGDNGYKTFTSFPQPNPGLTNPSVPTTTQTLTNFTDSWKYWQSGALTTGWQNVGADDSTWPAGNGLLYVSTANLPAPKNTALTIGQTTYYFRRHFTFSGDPTKATLQLNTILDDGAVVYLNGVEVLRVGMPSGAVTGATLANRLISPENATFDGPFNIPAGALVNGDNVLAIEVHQQNAGSTDIVFGASLQATVAAATVTPPPLRITEISYNPKVDVPAGSLFTSDDYEYIELKNIGAAPLNLLNYQLTGGITFTFPSVTLPAGGIIVVAKNPTAFAQAYGTGVTVVGPYTDSLSNAGEEIRLADSTVNTILDFTYSDAWYPSTDNGGYTLTINNPAADPATWGNATSWHASQSILGTPGQDESGVAPAPNGIVINELLSHSHGTAGDWIEFKNTTGAPIDISGWYLSDSASNLLKYRIAPGAIVPANGYLVLNEFDTFGSAFGFSENGDQAYLSSSAAAGTLSGYRAGVDFGASESDVPFERYVTSTGRADFIAESAPTPGAANAAPKVGPIVINELMYHPSGTGDEYIELRNVSGADVPLYDPLNPANTWQFTDGVGFVFPTGSSIPAGDYALVVPIDPATFRAKYGIPANVQIFGPYTGALNNAGEHVQLSKPNIPDPGTPVSYIRVDDVEYGNATPWPASANGTGPSLTRILSTAYGNDVINWQAGPVGGTPGAPNFPTTNSTVVGRSLFYNHSAYDGNDSAANAADDGAISNKTALLPGQSASSANYSGFAGGINGIMIDVASLPTGSVPTADSFSFKVGAAGDPGTWTDAPIPTISVRTGAGTGGSDRITLTWADGAIVNQWLQVTVNADAFTGLATPDVFYFGNLVGDVGNNDGSPAAMVSATDVAAVRSASFAPVTPDTAADFNKDGLVNAADTTIVKANVTHSIALFPAPAAPPVPAPAAAVPAASATAVPAPTLVSPAVVTAPVAPNPAPSQSSASTQNQPPHPAPRPKARRAAAFARFATGKILWPSSRTGPSMAGAATAADAAVLLARAPWLKATQSPPWR